ncbi:MAG TPA: hypothetical protein VFE50_25795, partial [Cyclobacteriaceae bacterium]|nr:hypothetical protein [Cyclobacteriaceae bacterium]
MKIFSALVVLLLFCVACSDVKPDMSKPAVVGFPTPMFDGMIGAVQGQVMKTLSPQTLVYVQNATLTVGDQEYVKIFWNDTTGYVPRSWLLEDGRLGVVDCTEANPIEIFDDEQLKSPSGKTMSEMQLIAYKEMPNGLSKIVYMYEKDGARPWFGYFRHPVTSDSASMAFFNLYYEAFRLKRYENNPEPYEALKRDDRFNNIALRASVFGLPTSGAASAGHTEMKWVDANGNELTGDNIPGQFILHYIWDDDTESDGNHLGDD